MADNEGHHPLKAALCKTVAVQSDPEQGAEIISELRAELQSWMKAQGDLGVATEMRANSHKKKGSKPRAVK